MNLRICIIVSGKIIPGFVEGFISWVEQSPHITIGNVTIVAGKSRVIDENRRFSGIIAKRFYQILVWLESKLLEKSERFSGLFTQKDFSLSYPLLSYVKVTSNHNSIITPSIAPHLIRDIVDIIVNFSDCKLSNEITNQIKFGAILFRDSNWARTFNNSWDVAFWSVYHKSESTKFEILQQHQGAIKPIVNGFIRTQLYFSLNKAVLLEKEFSYLKLILKAFAANETFVRVNDDSKSARNEERPGVFALLKYSSQVLMLILKKIGKQFLGLGNRWGVAFANDNWVELDLSSGSQLMTRPGHYIADPFVVSRNGKSYSFVEEYSYKMRKGWISVYEISGGLSTFLGVALEENFHLSFPYIFDFEGETYMCPETSGKSEIRVYRCDQFPLKWSLNSVLMKDVNAADTMLFERSGKWWMFTNMDPARWGDNCSELSIFHADSPLSNEWEAHEGNPVMIDSGKARNGGLLRDGERIFRVGQAQGYDVYGKRVSINEIISLNESTYEERCIKHIEPDFFENLNGTHHVFSNSEITVYDFVSVKKKWI